ncbi:MAG: maltose alpha-D-glucosyltransferase [Gammaproteobacteria bacterium]|nr:MAG: maltose alpha-D-glucosyltransferase [Gammaproteobacteria bacterium]
MASKSKTNAPSSNSDSAKNGSSKSSSSKNSSVKNSSVKNSSADIPEATVAKKSTSTKNSLQKTTVAKNSSTKKTFLKDPTWYKDAVIYQVHVKSYFDSNNDGVGDFVGLIDKLDYIAELGVNAIWLLPFYPSPMRDDGYDIAEYRAIHPAYGTMADARRFIAEAHKRGLRIITEMVINHTSDQHPWFQKSRTAKKDSKWRNFYVWSDTNQKYEGTRIIFSDTESSNWTWDPVAGQYFWHRFYSNQPDLNFDNPEVLKEVLSIMHYWFDIGVDGLRLDAIPYLVEREGTANENLPETHAVLKTIRADLEANYPDRMLLAEANLWPEDIQQYFGNGDECHMAFHFPLMPRMYMAIAQEDRFPIIDILRQMPEIPQNCQWAIFLRNHDELTLEMVTDQERDYLWNHYAADKRARINLGIRRRLAPLVERDRRRIELLNSLLLSMPGTPTLYYGDEIGMGDNIFLGDRHGVRTPMQWTDDRNGGFSRADPASLIAPAIMDPLYGFQAINVEAQAHDTHSLLNWTRRMLAVRKQQKAFGRGSLKMLAPANRRILAYLREYVSPEGATEIILCVANVSRAAQAGELDLSAYAGKIPVEMVGGTSFPVISKLNYQLTLPPYGFYWFLLADETQMPGWYVAPVERTPELTTVIIKNGLEDLMQVPALTVLETQSLPSYLPKCAWVGHPGEPIGEVKLSYTIPIGEPADLLAFTEVEVNASDSLEKYFLPVGFVPDHLAGTPSQQLAIARLRQKRTAGLLTDAFTLPEFNRRIINFIRDQVVQPFAGGELQFIALPDALPLLQTIEQKNWDDKNHEDINLVATKDANGSVVIDEKLVLKPIRKVTSGVHPEMEMNAYLHANGFENIALPLGEVRRVDANNEQYTLIILQAYVSNQGDAWQWTQNTLERALRGLLTAGTSSMDMQFPALDELQSFAQTLGRRLGEMHALLAGPAKTAAPKHKAVKEKAPKGKADVAEVLKEKSFDNTRFGYVETSASELAKWIKSINDRLEQALVILREYNSTDAEWLVANANKITALIRTLAKASGKGARIRVHGNFSLTHVLVVRGDAYFVHFEDGLSSGTPDDDLRQSPVKDVADMLCSFDDAGAMAIRSAQAMNTATGAEQIRAIAGTYNGQVHAAFYDAYYAATASVPALRKADGDEAKLKLHSIDNRLTEILKRLHHPDSLDVVIQGLIRIIK